LGSKWGQTEISAKNFELFGIEKPPDSFKSGGFYGTSVLIGLFEKPCITNGFLDFRASNFLVYFTKRTRNLPWTGCSERYRSNSNAPILF